MPRLVAASATSRVEVQPEGHVRRARGCGRRLQQGVQAAAAADPARAKAVRRRRRRGPGDQGSPSGPAPLTTGAAGHVGVPRRRRLLDRPRRSSASTSVDGRRSPARRRSRRMLIEWFNAIGVPLSEIYGMSESTGAMTWEPYGVKPGTVGPAIPGVRGPHRRRRRGDLPRRQRLPGLPRRPETTARDARRRLAAHRRHRRDRRRRLPAHRRPQEGADHHRRRARTSARPTSRRP